MMNRPVRCLLSVLLAAVVTPTFASAAVIRGVATYRERIALTPGAVFEAELLEVSRAPAAGKVVARVRKSHVGQIPISFEIPFNPRHIDAHRRYAVRASISEGGRIRFASDRGTPLPTEGFGRKVTLLLHGTPAGTGLENNRWRVTRIGTELIGSSSREHDLWIQLDPRAKRVSGSGGCNRISGPYKKGDATLRFGVLARTQMACITMERENAFLHALEQTRRYWIRGRYLDLLDESGRQVLRFEEANLR